MKKEEVTQEFKEKCRKASKNRWNNQEYQKKIKKAHSHKLPDK